MNSQTPNLNYFLNWEEVEEYTSNAKRLISTLLNLGDWNKISTGYEVCYTFESLNETLVMTIDDIEENASYNDDYNFYDFNRLKIVRNNRITKLSNLSVKRFWSLVSNIPAHF